MEFLRDVKVGIVLAGPTLHEADAEIPWDTKLCKEYHKHEMTPICGTEEVETIDMTED